MTEQNEWYRLLTIARFNSAQDLQLSNQILSIVDEIIRESEKGPLPPEKMTQIAKTLMEISRNLTNQSKEVSASVSRLAGVL